MGKSRYAVAAIGTAVILGLTFVPSEYHQTVAAVSALGSITPVDLAVGSYQLSSYGYSSNPYGSYGDNTNSMTMTDLNNTANDMVETIHTIVLVAKLSRGINALFALLLYFTVVANFPIVGFDDGDKRAGGRILDMGIIDCCSCYDGTAANCFWALCCTHARAAATMHSTGTLNYFVGCMCMLAAPSLVLCWASLGGGMFQKLGAHHPPDCCASTFQSFFCVPCKVAREAAALDAVQGLDTNLCGVAQKVSNDYRQYP